MSYFAHGYMKAFVGTKPSQAAAANTANGVDNGLLIEAGVPTSALGNVSAPNALGLGTYGFFNKDSYKSVNVASAEVTTGQSLILAGASILQNDKIGPFHGGYAESNKSKMINPKLVRNFYKMSDAKPEQSVWHVGVTNNQPGTTVAVTTGGTGYTDGFYANVATTVAPAGGTGLTLDIEVHNGIIISAVENNVGSGYSINDVLTPDSNELGYTAGTEATITLTSVGVAACEFEFLCGETYNLFINLYGSPVLRVFNHDAYKSLAAYTGCCPEGTISPIAVDSTLVMIDWATQIIESAYLKDFIRPIVYTEAGDPLFATAEEAVAAGHTATDLWSTYVSTGHTDGALAGIRIEGAYVDTQFNSCTFQCSDFYNKEIVQMDISLIDDNGAPCEFDGLCIETECCGFGGQGFGNTYLRELILCESYLQNNFSTDPRIREITQGNDLRDALATNAFYTKYVIQHIVPRYNNPSSVHDDDQYNLCIYVPSGVTATALETFMETWLSAAGNPLGDKIAADGIESFDHTACTIKAI